MKWRFLATVVTICVFTVLTSNAQAPIWQGQGRIAVSADGNEHDDDDWGATPMTLALLAAKGLQDKVVVYVYSDHIWGSNQEKPMRYGRTPYEHMRDGALGGQLWFGFDKTKFICGVDNAEVAYEAIKEAINDSSEGNPLIIIASGPLQVIGEAIHRADKDKRRFVTVISHGRWNNIHADNPANIYWDKHSGWTLDQLKKSFGTQEGGGVTFIFPADQNGGREYEGLQARRERFDWIKTSPARNNPLYKPGSWDWLYNRLELTTRDAGKNFDVSDAGQVIFMLTGNDKTNTDMVREIMENPEPRK